MAKHLVAVGEGAEDAEIVLRQLQRRTLPQLPVYRVGVGAMYGVEQLQQQFGRIGAHLTIVPTNQGTRA